MVNGVGQIQALDSNTQVLTYYLNKMGCPTGTNRDANLMILGYDAEEATIILENNLEGNGIFGDGIDGNLISSERYVESNQNYSNVLYGGAGRNAKIATNIDFFAGTATFQDDITTAKQCGIDYNPDEGKNWSYMQWGANSLSFVANQNTPNTTWGSVSVNLGQNSFNSPWKNTSYRINNFDMNAVDPTGKNLTNANSFYNTMEFFNYLSNADQWASETELNNLANATTSEEYYSYAMQIMQARLFPYAQ